MADGTKIEWTEATWNPITGCSVHSPGCTNCYAMKLAGTRLRNHPSREGLTIDTKAGPVWNGQVRFNEQWLDQPLRRKRSRMIFVCAHADLFHESVPDEWIDKVFAVMALCPQHTFQVLTKRSARMREYFAATHPSGTPSWKIRVCEEIDLLIPWRTPASNEARTRVASAKPLKNVWLGVSVEDQQRADERIPDLLATPAAVRWLSCEPLLGLLDVEQWLRPRSRPHSDGYGGQGPGWTTDFNRLDWIVAGGESGPNARGSTDEVEANMRALRDQCAAAGVPFFGKQNFKKVPLPDDLLVREFPHAHS